VDVRYGSDRGKYYVGGYLYRDWLVFVNCFVDRDKPINHIWSTVVSNWTKSHL